MDKALKSARITIRIPPKLKKMMDEYAQSENISVSSMIQMAIELFLTKDIQDESLLIAKMDLINEKVQHLSDNTDLAYQFMFDFFQYNFLFFPPLPEDIKTLNIKYAAAANGFKKFIIQFQRRLKTMPRLEEAILGNMLEEKQTHDPYAGKGQT